MGTGWFRSEIRGPMKLSGMVPGQTHPQSGVIG